MNKKLTIASTLAATVLVAGMFGFAPIATMAFNDNNSGWHVASIAHGDDREGSCATDEDLEAGSGETNGIWYHKTSPNDKDVYACKDHPTEQPEDDE
jgi:hypothetical protein